MSLLEHSPKFSLEEATTLARDLYGLDAAAFALPSERDQNFLLQDSSGAKYVLKIANALEERAFLEAQQQAMERVATRASSGGRITQAQSGDLLTEIQSSSGMRHFVWMVDWLSGVPLGELRRHSPELLRDLGRAVGRIDRALADFDHPAIYRYFHWDLARGLNVIREYESLIPDAETRGLVGDFFDEFARNVTPILPKLRKSAIHNDANDYNVIVSGGSVAGLIDYGDL